MTDRAIAEQVQERPQPAGLIDVATRMVAERGTAELTLRSLAAEANISSSAVLYHFGTKAALWNAVFRALDDRIASWLERQHILLQGDAMGPFGSAAIVSGLASALVDEIGGDVIGRMELAQIARNESIALDSASAERFEREDRFWIAVAGRMGEDDAAGRVWAVIVRGLVPRLLLEDKGAPRRALAHMLVQRMVDRLEGRSCRPLQHGSWVPAPPEQIVRIKGKQQIVDAAIRTIARHGVDGLTHRRVAAEAGLSLASTTYHYKTKLDIIVDAFAEVQQRGVGAIVSDALSPGAFLSSVTLDERDEQRTPIAALAALTMASIRSASLRELAHAMRHVRGVDGLRWMRARGHAGADLADGILWSAITTAISDKALTLPAGERRAYLTAEADAIFESLFAGL